MLAEPARPTEPAIERRENQERYKPDHGEEHDDLLRPFLFRGRPSPHPPFKELGVMDRKIDGDEG